MHIFDILYLDSCQYCKFTYHSYYNFLQVPSFRCELRVSGLTPGERYVFAVAAYTADGQLIGNLIGQSTKPILASHPLPILMTWAYLSQVVFFMFCHLM